MPRMIKKGIKRDARNRNKQLESYLSANKDGDLFGYDLGVSRVKTELIKFYSTGLNKVNPDDDLQAFAKVAGFNEKDRAWIS